MIHLLFLPLLLAGGLPYRSVQQCTGMESQAAYEITITAVLSILPTSVRTFLEANLTEFRNLVVADVDADIRGTLTTRDRLRHFIELDIEAPVVDVAQRRAAVARFPRDKEKAKELFKRHGPYRGGVLLWIIEERYEGLRQAFRSGDPQQTLLTAAELLHFSADAAMPLQVSDCCFSPDARSDETRAPASVQRGLYHRTFTAFQEVLAFEVSIHPDRVSPSTRPLEDAFQTATQAYDMLDHVLADELSCRAEFQSQLSAADLDHKCRFKWNEVAALPYMRMQVEKGALLAANLIVGAWTEAGKPELKAAAAPPSQPAVAIPHTGAVLYVGSQNSTVYHRASCSHAARIKAENRVTFENADKAKTAARTPCKSCKPDSPAKPPP